MECSLNKNIFFLGYCNSQSSSLGLRWIEFIRVFIFDLTEYCFLFTYTVKTINICILNKTSKMSSNEFSLIINKIMMLRIDSNEKLFMKSRKYNFMSWVWVINILYLMIRLKHWRHNKYKCIFQLFFSIFSLLY